MSKGKGKRRGKKSKGGNAGNSAINSFWLQLARETIGNFAGQIMADNAEKCVAPASGGKGEDAEDCDVAADVLRVLGESAPKSIAELLKESNTTLTPLLAALRTLRDFRLIEMSGDDEDSVRLTASGTRTASTLRREQIEHDGRKQLAS
jgi:hypothetical protein